MPRWIAALMPFNSSGFTLTLSHFYAVYMNENRQLTINHRFICTVWGSAAAGTKRERHLSIATEQCLLSFEFVPSLMV